MSVKFQYGTQADYDSLENFDSNCIYFITDTQRVYRGDTLYASGIKDVRVNGESVKVDGIVDISVPTAGENITIENNVISLADDFIAEVEKKADKTYVNGELAKKQNNLTAGAGISINEDNVISTSANFQVEIVGLDEQGLPSVNEPSSQVLYLTHSTQTEVSDVYNEWLWIYNTEIESFVWEKIGSTQADLSGYAQKSELPTKTSDLTNDSNFVSDGNYVHTDNNFTTPEKQKLDTLENYVDTAVKSCNTAAEKATEIYNTVETKLNNGELKGEKGDKGDKGDRGYPGDKGESGLLVLSNTSVRMITTLGNHLYYTETNIKLQTLDTVAMYLELPQGTFLLVEKEVGSYGEINLLRITIWGSCTFDNNKYKYGIHQYKYNTIGGFIENSFVLDTKSIETAIANLKTNKQDKLTAGAGISITDNGVISSDVGLKMIVLGDGEELPPPYEGKENTIYFKRNTTEAESDDWYNEYILVDSGFELIGTTKADLSGYAQKSELPTKTSELENDSNFVSDANYVHTDNNYTKEEKAKLENDVATKDYVEQEIATFDFIKIVEALPEQGLPNRTYFVPKTDQQTNDLYDEYMWVNNKWEFVGTRQIEVDLTNYVKSTDFATSTKAGVVKVGNGNGLYVSPSTGTMQVAGSSSASYKEGASNSIPVTASVQDIATFYGLAKAAGDTTQSQSSNAVGKYTDEAKTKIQNMLGVQPKFELGNGLQLVDGILSVSYPDGDNIKYGTEVINNE